VKDVLDHLPRLRRYARALTGDRFAADDLVQDTIERALSRSLLFRQESKLDSWLLTIMHNIFIGHVRRQAARPLAAPLDDKSMDAAVRGTEADMLGVRDLDRALAQLPIEQREVILLVGLEDLSYDDTANILGIPVGTVMSRLSRGRERLRSILAGKAPVTSLKVVK
jgi:RNA polymerase sigma-70 factor (ECF subfamily)